MILGRDNMSLSLQMLVLRFSQSKRFNLFLFCSFLFSLAILFYSDGQDVLISVAIVVGAAVLTSATCRFIDAIVPGNLDEDD